MPVRAFFDLCLELFYPSRCHLCGEIAEVNSVICDACEDKIERIGDNRCDICGKRFEAQYIGSRLCGDCILHKPAFDCVRAFARYKEPMSEMVQRLKYKREFQFLDWMTNALLQVYQREYSGENFALIIPVPLHWRRLLWRGYNQALILAKPLSKKLGIPLAPDILVRTRHTSHQVGLSPAKRKENIKASFRVKNRNLVEGKKILLVDDIVTTGVTVDEAAKTLKKSGADRVCVLALART